MDRRDLNSIFALTALALAVVGAVAFAVSPDWAARFTIVAIVSLLNWFALACILGGITGRNVMELVMGFMIKPLTLLGFVIIGSQGLIEVSSFLLGFNLFFIVLGLRMAFRAASPELKPSSRITMGFKQAHG